MILKSGMTCHTIFELNTSFGIAMILKSGSEYFPKTLEAHIAGIRQYVSLIFPPIFSISVPTFTNISNLGYVESRMDFLFKPRQCNI